MIKDTTTHDLAALTDRVGQMERHIGELMGIVRTLVTKKGDDHPVAGKIADPKVQRAFYQMTPKQHVALQMIIAGCSNLVIAQQLGITENTAKVHVRNVYAKLDAKSRAQAVAKALPAMEAMTEDEYMEASAGIPRNWASTMRLQSPDPARDLYM